MQMNLLKHRRFFTSQILVGNNGVACNEPMRILWQILDYRKINNIKEPKCLKSTLAKLLSQI